VKPEAPQTLSYSRARFTTELPLNLRYTPEHFWIAQHGPASWRIGLTKFGSRLLGELVDYGFELPTGAPVKCGEKLGWIEGFKALSDLFCLARGEFLGPNVALEDHLTLINQDPYGAGWLYAVNGQLDPCCVDALAYAKLLDQTIDRLIQEA
jgi:glycine cleavage system H protein